MDLQVYIPLLSLCFLAGFSVVNASLNCMPRSSVCNGEEVVCNCTTNCNEVIHWWNSNKYFCEVTSHHNSNSTPQPRDLVYVQVIPNNCNFNLSGTFTSRLTFNASLNVTNNADTQIGCFTAPDDGSGEQLFSNNTCTPTREPSAGEQNSNITLHVANCTVPNPPRNLEVSMTENNQCESEMRSQCESKMRSVTIVWVHPRSPVTSYNFSCTSTDGDGNCSELLPANNTSFTLSVAAGIQYTIMVSALIDDRKSQDNPQLNLVAVKVVNETSLKENATIWLQIGNITSNLTIRYGPCSEPSLSYTAVTFMTPAIQLVNLTAKTMYCYFISATDTASDETVVGTCCGNFTTAEATSSPTTPETTINLPAIVGGVIGVIIILYF